MACIFLPLPFSSPLAEGSGAGGGVKWLSELNLRCFVLVLDACCWEAGRNYPHWTAVLLPRAQDVAYPTRPQNEWLQLSNPSVLQRPKHRRKRVHELSSFSDLSSHCFFHLSWTWSFFHLRWVGRQAALMKAILCQEGLLAEPFPASLT